MKYKVKVILQQSDEGFAASVPGLPGCHSQGATAQEALDYGLVDHILERLPVPQVTARPSS